MKKQQSIIWTIETVIARFEEAVQTAHCLPSARAQGYFNVWPAIFQGGGKHQTYADPKAVERMEETSRWLQWLDDPSDRHLIWLFAGGVRRKKIAGDYGISKSTLERRVKSLVKIIADHLNGARA